MAGLGLAKMLVAMMAPAVAVLCMMPVRVAVMEPEAILGAVDTAANLIVTVISLLMLGL